MSLYIDKIIRKKNKPSSDSTQIVKSNGNHNWNEFFTQYLIQESDEYLKWSFNEHLIHKELLEARIKIFSEKNPHQWNYPSEHI
jgi:hypothetical protein